jgi:uncharacterized protein (TIGR02284 family)
MTTTTTTKNDRAPKPDEMRRHVIWALNSCIEIDVDAEKGFALAAADVRDPALKKVLLARSGERADFVLELQAAIQNMGAQPENEGSVLGAAHRGWSAIRRALDGRSDLAVLEECLNGEVLGIEAYDAAINRVPLEGLSPVVHDVIQRHFRAIRASIADLNARLGRG